MNKLLTKIVGAALGAAMAIGVGVAVANSGREFSPAHASISSSHDDYSWSGYDSGTSKSVNGVEFTIGDFKLTCAKDTGSTNPTYYKNGDSIRMYSNNDITITSTTKYIGKVEFSVGQNTLLIASPVTGGGTYSSGTWTSANETTSTLVLNVTSNSRFDAVKIYPIESGGTTNHNLTYAVGSQGSYDGSTTKSFSVAESGTHTVKTPAEVGITANTGYVFTTWNDGSNNYNPSSTYTMGTSDVTLTAQWVAGVALSYNKNNNSATGSTATTYVVSGGTQTVAACGFSLSGYAFSHWNTESDDSGVSYDPTDTINNFTSALTLYAIWEDLPEFELVTDATELTKDTRFILVGTGTYSNTTYNKAMIATTKTANGSFGNNADVTLSNGFSSGSIATSENATVFTLGGSAGAWTLKNGESNRIIFTGTSNNNIQNHSNAIASGTETFTITSPNSGTHVLINGTGDYSSRGLRMNVNNGSPLFSNYGSGNQQPIYMFADIAEAQYGETDNIEVATLPQTHWHVGQTFSDAGMIINAWDNANHEAGNSEVVTTYTVSISGVASGVAFDENDIGSHTVTVTYTENGNDFTDTFNIYVYATATYQLVEDEPSGGWAGSYIIVGEVSGSTSSDKVSDGTYAMRSTGVNLDYVGNYDAVTPVVDGGTGATTITTGQEFQFSIATITGGYSIQGKDGKYIGWGSSNSNGMTSSDSALVNTITFSDGSASIVCSAGTKGLKLDKSSGQFRYYSNPSVKLYKLVESSDVSDYADMFLETLSTGASAVCQYNESTHVVSTDLNDLKDAWKDLADLFDLLSPSDKQQFTQGTADENSESNVEQALALYDFVAAKYNTRLEGEGFVSDYDFMERGITPSGSSKVLESVLSQNNAGVITIVVITSVVSLLSVGAYFLLRKRKER